MHDCTRPELPDLVFHDEDGEVIPTLIVRLSPASSDAAPLAFTLSDFPGVSLTAGNDASARPSPWWPAD